MAYDDPKARNAALALTLGYLSGIHNQLHLLREEATEEDDRDIDSAQVYLEGAFDKLNEVMARQSGNGSTPTRTIREPFTDKSEED